jgi:hypothetical protein
MSLCVFPREWRKFRARFVSTQPKDAHAVEGLTLAQVPIVAPRAEAVASSRGVSSEDAGRRLIQIRSASTHGQRSSASILINRMYAWRGYQTTPLPDWSPPSRLTLVASDHDETVGTVTVGFDQGDGLYVDDLFPQEVAGLRGAGHRLCEFTKLAMDTALQSQHVLASLFHTAYLYAHRVMDYDRLLIEVNPRHVAYYRRMLGFKVLGPARLNQRVNAPAVMLCLDLTHSRAQIARLGGLQDAAVGERSLYPYFFSPREEAGVMARMRQVLTCPAGQRLAA